MDSLALSLFVAALQTAAEIALPLVCGVAAIGVAVGIVQTIFQIQDQNVAFAPKLAAVALAAVAGGPAAFAMLSSLLTTIIAALPRIAHI